MTGAAAGGGPPAAPRQTPDEAIIAALSAGATGYLTKDATREDICRALEAADVNRIFAKTGSRDRTQAAAFAHRHGLVAAS